MVTDLNQEAPPLGVALVGAVPHPPPCLSVECSPWASPLPSVLQGLLEEALRLELLDGPPQADLTKPARREAGRPLTTADVANEIVIPATLAKACALIDVVSPDDVGPASWFISHAWSHSWKDTVSAVEAAGVGPHDKVWIDVCCNNQHKAETRPFEWWTTTFQRSIKGSGKTLLVLTPWDEPVALSRSWCLFEIYSTITTGGTLHCSTPEQDEDRFMGTLMSTNLDHISESLGRISLEHAQASSRADQESIWSAVELTSTVHHLDEVVLGAVRHWLLDAGRRALTKRPKDSALMNSLGRLLRDLGEYDQAGDMMAASLALRTKQLGKRHELRLLSAMNLANVRRDQGRLSEAEKLYRMAYKGFRQRLGHAHENTLLAEANLANALADQGKLAAAEALYRRAWRHQRRVWGDDHEYTVLSLNNLAVTLTDSGRPKAAVRLLQRAHHVLERRIGPRHRHTLGVMENIASALAAQGKFDAAEEVARQVLQGRRATLGPSHRDTLRALGNIAKLQLDMGDAVKAQVAFERVLGEQEATIGAGHVDTAMTALNLAGAMRELGHLADAEDMCRRALRDQMRVVGGSHPDSLVARLCLAVVLCEEGRLREAEEQAKHSMDGFRWAVGTSSSHASLARRLHADVMSELHHHARLSA